MPPLPEPPPGADAADGTRWGLVIRYQSNVYDVFITEPPGSLQAAGTPCTTARQTSQDPVQTIFKGLNGVLVQCSVKGLLKKEGVDVLVGDRVSLDRLDHVNRTARIVAVDTRQSQLSRPKVANVKQVLVVCATRQPDLDPQQLDRYLTHVTLAGLTPLICFNKVDLLDPEALQTLESIKARYEALGIAVVLSSIFQPHSIATLRQQLGDTSTVLAGASGVGKSSLINALMPQAELDVKTVSSKQQRGRHTTRSVTLLPLIKQATEQAAGQANEAEKTPLHSTIVDSPGFSYLKFDQVTPQQLEASFPEFAAWRPACRYNNCLHEPHQTTAVEDEAYCAVLANADQLDTARLASYHTFLAEAHAAQDTLAAQGNTEEATYKTLHGGKGKDQDLRILKLKTKQRAASRRKERQQLSTITLDEFDPRMQDDLD